MRRKTGGVAFLLALAAGLLLQDCTLVQGGPDGIRYYGGSVPTGDYVEIRIDESAGVVRRINHSTGEDSGWLFYGPETDMASGFTILNRAIIGVDSFVVFAEFPGAACVYQEFDSSVSPTASVGYPVYVVSRESVGRRAYYGQAYNWMEFRIDDLGESDMNTGFAGMDLSSNNGRLFGAGYSHRRELRGEGVGGTGVEDINPTGALRVDEFAYSPELVSHVLWDPSHPGDMGYATVMSGTASGTNILDRGILAGGGMGMVIPQTVSRDLSPLCAGTYFTLFYELDGQSGAAENGPLKIVVTSGGSLRAFGYEDSTAEPASALFAQPLVPVADFSGGPGDVLVSET